MTCPSERAMKMSDLEQLKSDWRRIHGSPMPPSKVRIAEQILKNGGTVAIPPALTPIPIDDAGDSSLMDWDRQDDKNGNAFP
jgi:hypothetical protein